MFVDRTMLSVTSVGAFVAALLLAQVRVAEDAPIEEWWLPALLALVGAVVGVLAWLSERAEQDASSETALAAAPPSGLMVTEAAGGEPDDLTRIEGIGQQMSEALLKAGYDSFAKIAAASEDELRAAIEAAGLTFAPSVPTWAEQAALAAQGAWDALGKLQDELKAGRRVKE